MVLLGVACSDSKKEAVVLSEPPPEISVEDMFKNSEKSKGYKWFTGDNYDVNIVGVRNAETEGKVTNRFDDCVTLSYKDENGECAGRWKHLRKSAGNTTLRFQC